MDDKINQNKDDIGKNKDDIGQNKDDIGHLLDILSQSQCYSQCYINRTYPQS